MSYSRGPGVAHWHSIDTVRNGLLPPQNPVSSILIWPTANLAIYSPVLVLSRVVVKSLWYANGSVGTGNYDIGLFDRSGTALLRKGSTAKGTTAEETVWDCTDTLIGPGLYYLALSCSNNSDSFAGVSVAAPFAAALGVYTESAAVPLPATATFGIDNTLAIFPVIGMFLSTIPT